MMLRVVTHGCQSSEMLDETIMQTSQLFPSTIIQCWSLDDGFHVNLMSQPWTIVKSPEAFNSLSVVVTTSR